MTDKPQPGAILSSDEAKAGQELAKVGGKAIDAVTAGGGYLAKVLGDLPHDTVGILGDLVKRARKLLADNAERKLRERGEASPILPSPSLLLPLLAGAEKETREELADLWAGLLASAMQPGVASRVRREFFVTLERMEPIDALVLAALGSRPRDISARLVQLASTPQLAGVHHVDIAVSLEQMDAARLVNQLDSGGARLSAYGAAFIAACEPSLRSPQKGGSPEGPPPS